MKMPGVIICCLFAALTLSCESAHQVLNSISDLKDIDFGQSAPRHSLLLLYWFANTVNIDHHNTITVNFDPNTDFGSHHYGNYENRLDLPRRYRYYTVGNLCSGASNELPDYIRNPPNRGHDGRNRDRIIFSAERQNSGAYRIYHVYLTEHEPLSNDYDPYHTYQISTNLLREIRQFGNPTALWMRLRNQQQRNNYDSFHSTEQSRSARGTSFSRGTGGGTGEDVCKALLLILIMVMFLGLIISLSPQK